MKTQIGEKDFFQKVKIRGVEIHSLTENQCVRHIIKKLNQGEGGWVATSNLDHLRRLERDSSFSSLYSKADLVVPDGMPLVWASKLQGTPLPERVAGSNLIGSLSRMAADHRKSIFLLGGSEGTAEAASDVLKSRIPHLRIAGVYSPQIKNDLSAIDQITEVLWETHPDIVFVALGSPKQEKLIRKLQEKNILPNSWWLGVGVSFSFLCGEVERAPKEWQSLGLEWLHRLIQEPRRLAKRYLIQGLPYAAILLTQAALQGVALKVKGVIA